MKFKWVKLYAGVYELHVGGQAYGAVVKEKAGTWAVVIFCSSKGIGKAILEAIAEEEFSK